ncbi:MAG: glycerol dehydrogenase [Proteobacteria bacterium]|nr:glycerol dehydrogenase [Pseudomonadota bacterium]
MLVTETGKITGARFPGRYIQGRNLIGNLGHECAILGSRALCIVDNFMVERLTPLIEDQSTTEISFNIIKHGGECSKKEIERCTNAGRNAEVDLVVGIGGGKVLDTAKICAADLQARCIVVPTIASSDAPCSALGVIYNDDGTVDCDRFLDRNPDLVFIDTQIVAGAPSRFLSAGIGDALATYYEAESCRRAGKINCWGTYGSAVAFEIAALCRKTIFEHAVAALGECDTDTAGPALESIIEANILMSGVGFESGGVAAAHAIHHGLCELPDVHHHLHGEKVAIGVLAGLLLHNDEAEFQKVRSFCNDARLPTKLADLGISEATTQKLQIVAERACRTGEIIHNEPMAVTPAMVVDALDRLI